MKTGLITLIISFIISSVLCALITRFLIPKLKSLKMGQKILDIGPRWHKGKEGTPVMGGLAMIISAVIVMLCAFIVSLFAKGAGDIMSIRLVCVIGYALVNGLIGIIDDRVKLLKKQNEGLKAWQKYLLQLAVAGVFLFIMKYYGCISTKLSIPFTDIELELGWGYYVISLLLLTGMVNAVNLTDGIDGLASSVTFIFGCFIAVAAVITPDGGADASLLAGIITGVCAGFLVYNFYPAKIFMGDTGSLFLGGLVVGSVFLIGSPLLVLLAGLWFVIETASVILQVASFKLTGKRIFKMSPIHHHFEMCGWSEVKIVTVAVIVTVVACAVAGWGL